MKSLSAQLKNLLLGLLACACLEPNGRAELVPTPALTAASTVGPVILRDESVDQVLVLIERWTGKTILRPQALPSTTLTITLKDNVTREEAIRALETLLILNGIAINALDDKFLKVTALNAARSEAPELIDGSTLRMPPSGRLASKLFQLNFLRVSEFMPQIAGLLNPAAASPPVVFENANAALITDSLSNLQRIEALLERLDQPHLGGLRAKFYPLRFAKASDVVSKLHTVLAGSLQTQLGTLTTYNPEDRANQIILITDPRQYELFDDLIAKFDVKSDANTRNDVIYLKYATAKDVATSLAQLVATQNSASRKSLPDNPALARQTVTSAPAPAATSQAPSTASLPANADLKIEPSNQFSSQLTILPEERSNAIIVAGTEGDIRLIKELVAKIDIVLAQVRIEVVIAEVTLENDAASGISALGLTVSGSKLVGFQGSLPGLDLTNGVINRSSSSSSLDLAALVSLSTTPRKSIANILSVPTILTTHGKDGNIFVGQSVPVISSYLSDSTTSGSPTGAGYRSTVTSQDIGIQLSIKPLIGNDGTVQLEIKQEVNDILGSVTIDGNAQPTIGKRSTQSYITAKSGEIIVLGGMQRTSESQNTTRLGPIPFLGDLLGSRSRQKNRTDLVFFLRPTVLPHTPGDSAQAMQQISEFSPDQRIRIERALAPAAPESR